MSPADSVQLSIPEWLDNLSDEPEEETLAQLEHTVAEWSHLLAQVLDQAMTDGATSQSERPPLPHIMVPPPCFRCLSIDLETTQDRLPHCCPHSTPQPHSPPSSQLHLAGAGE